MNYRGGRCGKELPAEEGGGGPKGRRQGGNFRPTHGFRGLYAVLAIVISESRVVAYACTC